MVRDGLLNAIAYADGDDETAWLAFADWLEEAGNPDHAIVRRSRAVRVPGTLDQEWMRAWAIECVSPIRQVIGAWPTYAPINGWLRIELSLTEFHTWQDRLGPLNWPTKVILNLTQPEDIPEAIAILRSRHWPGMRFGLRVHLTHKNPHFPMALADVPELTRLELHSDHHDHRIPFGPMLPMPGLRSLMIQGAIPLQPVHLDAIARLPRLETLWMRPVLRLGAHQFTRLQHATRLRDMEIHPDVVLPMEVLKAWTKVRSLERIALGCFEPLTAEAFTAIQQCPLHELDLRGETRIIGCNVSGFTKLESLSLAGAGIVIPDDWLAALARLPRLRLLDLTGTRISDRGIEHLATAPMLEELELHGCDDLTDRSLRALEQTPSLQLLNIARCQHITPHAQQSFRDALPECRLLDARMAADH